MGIWVKVDVIRLVVQIVQPFYNGDELFIIIIELVGVIRLLGGDLLAECPEIGVGSTLAVGRQCIAVVLGSCTVTVQIHIYAVAHLVHLIKGPFSVAYDLVHIRQIVGFCQLLVVEHTVGLCQRGQGEIPNGDECFVLIAQILLRGRRPPRL